LKALNHFKVQNLTEHSLIVKEPEVEMEKYGAGGLRNGVDMDKVFTLISL
jgi:hypothetical protein